MKWQLWPVTLRRLLLEREARLLLLHRAIEIQLNDIALYLMWQSPPHGSLFFFGQSLANLLTIIGNGGWSRTIISGVPDVLKLEIEVGIGPTFADLQSAAKTTIDNSTIKFTVWWSRTTLFGFGVRGPRHEDQDCIEMALPLRFQLRIQSS